jgi:RimJ/RimL family protein N-acetyltransferase
MRPEIETRRMLLRPLSADDAGLLHELDSDPEVMRYLSGGPPTPLQAIESRILPGMLAIAAAGDGHGAWAAMDHASGAFVGWFMLRPGSDGVSSEAGYRLLRRWWGRGLATEGLEALLQRAFVEMGRERVFGTTYEENHASRRVMEKAGMRLVRRFRPGAEQLAAGNTFEPTDEEPWPGEDVEYAIGRQEWWQHR